MSAGLSGYLLQPLCRGLQGGVLFAKTQAHIPGTPLRLMEKTAPRHNRNADVLHKIMSEIPIIKQAQSAEIRHDVIGALRR